MSEDGDDEKPVVQVFKPHNFLKDKLGMSSSVGATGELAEQDIEKADQLIEKLCENCLSNLKGNLDALIVVWDKMIAMPTSDERSEKEQELFTLAHEIKDIASLCHYTLAAHFAESLRDYVAETTYDLKNQRIIIQAHIDALKVVLHNDIKADAGPAAEELKQMVKIAISKYK